MHKLIPAAVCAICFLTGNSGHEQKLKHLTYASMPHEGFNDTSTESLLFVDGKQYSDLEAALRSCPAAGCLILDNIPETFSSNTFAALRDSTYTEVHLMRQTWITNAEIVIPTKSQLYGSGRGDAGAVGTVIQAGPLFPSSTPVIEMSKANPGFGVRVENLTVDCHNRPGAIGIQNLNAQEESGVRHALVLNCPEIDLDIEGSGAQNSGPYEDLELLNDRDCTNCTAASAPLVVNRVASFRGIPGATINSDGTIPPDVGAQIDSAGTYADLHFEHVTAGIVVGSKNATSGAVISNVYCSVPGKDCVKFSSAFPNQNLTAIAIVSNATNLITDELTGTTLTVRGEGGSVGIYAIGNGKPPGVLTTSANLRMVGSLVTTAATSDDVTIPGLTPEGHCALTPTNAEAARDSSGTYISAKARNKITISHPPNASRNWDIQCRPY